MNDHDRSNLQYIMSLNDEQFDDWAHNISDDDVEYAIELIKQARSEMAMQEQTLLEESLAESDFAEACAVLQNFRL